MNYYILKDKKPIQVEFSEYSKWIMTNNKLVVRTTVRRIIISTVFLGMNHNYSDDGPAILFETMVFGGEHDQYVKRYAIWDEAVKGHNEIVKLVKSKLNNK